MTGRASDWAVRHKLDSIEVGYRFVAGELVSISAHGRSSTKRTALWHLVMSIDGYDESSDLEHDFHSLLCALTSAQPVTQDQARNVMVYGSAVPSEDSLPFDW